ncbi:MAG: hypothetical protein HC890_13470 [Chloroflexaceae bacterium]|nr:hypothetical protein [Chloroflexaceae bacterium]
MEFDVYLAHNSVDRLQVRKIAEKLRQRGLKPWLEEEQIDPELAARSETYYSCPAAVDVGQPNPLSESIFGLTTITCSGITDPQQALPPVKSAAVFLGSVGLGKWQAAQLLSLTNQFIKQRIPVISVLLPGVSRISNHLSILRPFPRVDFETLEDERALYHWS